MLSYVNDTLKLKKSYKASYIFLENNIISCFKEIPSHNHPIIWTAKIAAHIFLFGCGERFLRQMSSNLPPTSLYRICSLNPPSKRHQYVALLLKMSETIQFGRASMCYMQARSNHRICPICLYSQLLDFHKRIRSVPHSLCLSAVMPSCARSLSMWRPQFSQRRGQLLMPDWRITKN